MNNISNKLSTLTSLNNSYNSNNKTPTTYFKKNSIKSPYFHINTVNKEGKDIVTFTIRTESKLPQLTHDK